MAYSWYNEEITFTDNLWGNAIIVLHQLHYGASYHLWYVYMLIGLYFIIPILGKFIRNASDKELLYFLIVWLVVMCFNQPYLLHYNPQIDLHYITGYIGYLVLGHYLAFKKFPEWCNAGWFWVLFLIALIIIIAGTYFASTHYKTLSIIFYDPISRRLYGCPLLPLWLANCGLFKLSPKAKKVRDFVGSYTFGIYLAHALILDVLGDDLNIDYKVCNPVISIPLIALFVYLSALLLVYLISKIPFGKWVAM